MVLIVSIDLSWRNWRLKRLVDSTPLLDGYEHLELELPDMRQIHRQRNVCKMAGHLWELEALIPSTSDDAPYTYEVVCERCFPHIHSRRSIRSYNLFDVFDKEQD